MTVSQITTHILDQVTGRPAAGVGAVLYAVADDGGMEVLAKGVTNTDGRIRDLGPEELPIGVYRIEFATGEYFAATGTATFYPTVSLTFTMDNPAEHYHVPLLLSPFAFSTYRGS